jgi:DNA-binding NarL/FixJ family response regulator
MISVLIADDQALIRTAVRNLVDNEDGMRVVGEAIQGAEAVDLAKQLQPDVILMDIRMPVLDGIEATRRILADPDLAEVRVLILTTFEEDEYVLQALRAGASGFIGKGTEPQDLLDAIRTVQQGDALLSPRATRSLIDRYISPTEVSAVPPQLAMLTAREREVLLLVAKGYANDAIADELFISSATAKTHVNRTMTKLLAHDRAQLVIIAYESGLLRPGRD